MGPMKVADERRLTLIPIKSLPSLDATDLFPICERQHLATDAVHHELKAPRNNSIVNPRTYQSRRTTGASHISNRALLLAQSRT